MEKIRIFMEEICRRIVNKPVKYIGRASSMLCLGLGEKKISNISYNEKLTEVYEYYIHVQCPWRIVDLSNKKIIVASGDIYEPRTDDVNIEKFISLSARWICVVLVSDSMALTRVTIGCCQRCRL